MIAIRQHQFVAVRQLLRGEFSRTKPFMRDNWQGIPTNNKPEMAVHELTNVVIEYDMRGQTDLDYFRRQVVPNLPWADDHFLERVCGQPINPGVEWRNWPYALSADGFRDGTGQFNHNYMERYWPKYAGRFPWEGGTEVAQDYEDFVSAMPNLQPHMGIRGRYGDLNDVVTKLVKTPTTRQACLPIYFPEDTALIEGRQPCSMYYQFHVTDDGRMDIIYPMRSCDFIRHFADDVYMTIRLLLWMIEKAAAQNSYFDKVKPGRLLMVIANLHMFRNDHLKEFGK